MRADIKDYIITSCLAKDHVGKMEGLLFPLATLKKLWQALSLDFIVELPSSQGSTSILVVVAIFTKMVQFIPCHGSSIAQQTTDLFIQQVFWLRGLPTHLISDHSSRFISKFWQTMCRRLEVWVITSECICHQHTIPSLVGKQKKLIRLEQYLHCYTAYRQNDWRYLPPT